MVVAFTAIVAIGSLTVLHPDRSWWADEVRAHAYDAAALRADRKGHLVALAITIAIALLVPPILVITGLYRHLVEPAPGERSASPMNGWLGPLRSGPTVPKT